MTTLPVDCRWQSPDDLAQLHTRRTNSSPLSDCISKMDSLKRLVSRKSKDKIANRPTFNHPQQPSPTPNRRPGFSNTTAIPEDAPPAYTAAPNALPNPSPTPGPNATTPAPPATDDPFAFLSTFDTLFLIDDSGSMTLSTRWRDTATALATITPICLAHDSDGIDLHFLNAPPSSTHHNLTTATAVHAAFSRITPAGPTPMGQHLDTLLRAYLGRYTTAPPACKPKPLNIIVLTDGQPSDDVETAFVSAAKKLDHLDAPAWQVGVQFFQVGDDARATRFLRSLDDELAALGGGCRDMVDTVPFEGGGLSGEGILKVVLGAVLRRLDRRCVGEVGGV